MFEVLFFVIFGVMSVGFSFVGVYCVFKAVQAGFVKSTVTTKTRRRAKQRSRWTRMKIASGSGLGRFVGWLARSNNNRAKLILGTMAVATVLTFFVALPWMVYTYTQHPLAESAMVDAFGKEPIGESTIHGGFLPDAEEFYGYSEEVMTGDRPSSWWPLLYVLWVFIAIPLLWAIALAYSIFSLREEAIHSVKETFSNLRNWFENLRENNILGEKPIIDSSFDTGELVTFPPLAATAAGVTVVEEKKGFDFTKLAGWLKRNSGEIIAVLFTLDEIFEWRQRVERKKATKAQTT